MEKYICISNLLRTLSYSVLSDYSRVFTIGKIYDIEECMDQPHTIDSEYYLYQINNADDGYPRILPKHYIKQLFRSLIDEREEKLNKLLTF